MATPYLGQLKLFASNRIPRGWAPCNGDLMMISENQTLFAILGTTYGGDGVYQFALPDLRCRVPMHAGRGPGLPDREHGAVIGAEQVVLTADQLPRHRHAVSTTGRDTALDESGRDALVAAKVAGSALKPEPALVDESGGGEPVGLLPPVLAMAWCIAVEGAFPTPA